jgi:hypothetical protein
MEQRAPGTLLVWANPFTNLRVPKIFNIRTDPYERADITSNTYYDWLLDHAFLLVPAQAYVGQFLMTFKEYPQRQKAASFKMDEVMERLKESGGSNSTGTRRGASPGSGPPSANCPSIVPITVNWRNWLFIVHRWMVGYTEVGPKRASGNVGTLLGFRSGGCGLFQDGRCFCDFLDTEKY